MVKLVFLFLVVLIVAVTAKPHPRQTQSKRAASPAHHSVDLHGRAATRVIRNHHGVHGIVHRVLGASAQHANSKVRGTHSVRSIRSGNHGVHGGAGNKGVVHRPVNNRGHRE